MLALLVAPSHKWLFELLYHDKGTLGHKIPEQVQIFTTTPGQPGMKWKTVDYNPTLGEEVRRLVDKEVTPDPGKRPAEDQGGQGSGKKARPQPPQAGGSGRRPGQPA